MNISLFNALEKLTTLRDRSHQFLFFLVFLLISIHQVALAANIGFTYQGRILNPDGTPVTASAVEINLQITGPQGGASTCVMYAEKHAVDLSTTSGLFSLIVGRGQRTDASTFALEKIFSSNLIYPNLTQCTGGYSKQFGDSLYLNVSFNDGKGVQTLAALEITPTPSSMDTLAVAGIPSQQVLRVDNSVGASGLSGSNYSLNIDNFSALLDLINGNSAKYAKASSSLSGNSLVLGGATSSQPQVSLVAPSTAFTSYSLSLPTSKGTSGQVLTSDGTGGMFWSTVSGGSSGSGGTSPWVASGTTISYSGGNVGIGTTAPTKLLDVNGDALINGILIGRGLGSTISNTVLGDAATTFTSNTTGYSNVALGYQSMQSNTTGYYNTGLGRATLNANTTGIDNTGVGTSALQVSTTGSRNTAVGFRSLFSNTTGQFNTAIGSFAGTATTGSKNIDVGYNNSGATTGNNNIIIGNTISLSDPAADGQLNIGNIIFGTGVTGTNSTVAGNVGIGTATPGQKLEVNGSVKISSGSGGGVIFADGTTQSTAAGTDPWTVSGTTIYYTTGNVGIGTTTPSSSLDVKSALGATVSVTNTATNSPALVRLNNDALDTALLGLNPSGSANGNLLTIPKSSYYYTVGSGGLAIGAANASGVIRFFTGGTANSNERMRIDSSGNVGINTLTPAYKLDVTGDINTSSCFRVGATTVGGTCTSDARLKENIHDYNVGLQQLLGLRLRTYQFNGLGEMPKTGETAVGVIAQEVEQNNPELVKTRLVKMHPEDTEKTEIKAVDYSQFTYMLINAVKELNAKLENENAQLKKDNAELKARLDKIETQLNSR